VLDHRQHLDFLGIELQVGGRLDDFRPAGQQQFVDDVIGLRAIGILGLFREFIPGRLVSGAFRSGSADLPKIVIVDGARQIVLSGAGNQLIFAKIVVIPEEMQARIGLLAE